MKFVFSSTVVLTYLLAVAIAQQNVPANNHPNELNSVGVRSCSASNVISVSNFGITYYRFNHSVHFSMIGTAKQDGLSPIMNMDVTAYGTKASTQAIRLCDFAQCPFSRNSTTIRGSQPLPVSYASKIPSAFWALPLEANLTLTFMDTDTSRPLSCLTATLSNGIRTQNSSIPWITGCLTVGLGAAAATLGVLGGGGANLAAPAATSGPAPVATSGPGSITTSGPGTVTTGPTLASGSGPVVTSGPTLATPAPGPGPVVTSGPGPVATSGPGAVITGPTLTSPASGLGPVVTSGPGPLATSGPGAVTTGPTLATPASGPGPVVTSGPGPIATSGPAPAVTSGHALSTTSGLGPPATSGPAPTTSGPAPATSGPAPAMSGPAPAATSGPVPTTGMDWSHYGIQAAQDLDGNIVSLDSIFMLGGVAAAGGAAAGAAGGTGAPHTPAVVNTPTGHSGPPAGRMDPTTLFLHFQSISTTGLLSLSYPSLYRAFTANFAWANFIIPLSAFRKAATRMRKCNIDSSNSTITSSEIPPVSSGSESSSGIATYVAQLGISEQDIYGIVFFVFLCACGLLLVLSLLIGTIIHLLSVVSKSEERREVWKARRYRWSYMSSNNTLRVLMVALGTLATFSFHQWTLKCTSVLSFCLSAFALAFVVLTLSIATFFILYTSTKPDGVRKLFTQDSIYTRRWGSMYSTLRERQLYFTAALWIIVLSRSAIAGFGQSNGFAQVVALIVLELVVCIAIFIYRPYYSRGYNRVNYLLQGTRLISHVLLLLFVEKLHINDIATTVIGFVLLIINSLVALVLIVLTVLKLGWGRLWYRRKHVAFEEKSQDLEPQKSQEVYNNGYDYYGYGGHMNTVAYR